MMMTIDDNGYDTDADDGNNGDGRDDKVVLGSVHGSVQRRWFGDVSPFDAYVGSVPSKSRMGNRSQGFKG